MKPHLLGRLSSRLYKQQVSLRTQVLTRKLHNLSIAHGPTEPPLFETTIPQHFASVVSRYGDRPAVITRSPERGFLKPVTQTLTYRKLDEESNQLARSLQQLGVRKGNRVAISLGNCREFAALTYAVFKLGAILVPLNPSFNITQIEAALSHLDTKVLIIGAVTDLAYKPTNGRSNLPLLQDLVPDLYSRKQSIASDKVPSLEHIILVNNLVYHPAVDFSSDLLALTKYEDLLLSPASDVLPDLPLEPHEIANIQYTSGTTSMPKAAMLSHRSILNNGALIANRMGLDSNDRIVVPPPLFHCFGCILGYMATATSGAAILFSSPAFDPVASLKMCTEHDATGLYGVSTMLMAMLDVLTEGKTVPVPPKSLLKGIVAGSSVPESLMRKIYDTLGLRNLVICYGMTETSPVSCMTSPNDPFEKRTSSVGKVMPHTSVKVVDPHDPSRIVPIGKKGELAIAGYLVMEGYWGDQERTSQVRVTDNDGTVWINSGDEAEMDEKGFVKITGRIKDLIIRAGENIHPLEIENCLIQHPKIKDASAVGVPDSKYGESVAVFVIARPGIKTPNEDTNIDEITETEVKNWVKHKLSAHLIPKYVYWVKEYPKTASGKIQKFKLRVAAEKMIQSQ
ncbi:uncharacterized protein BROUX77_003869 [Berkeleyomyces rouxiae]|uniref:uncharacterized protein n=1 Tax=Berkeleyomyces rouxiae TaxID=2035830 RepID=UPI003B771930